MSGKFDFVCKFGLYIKWAEPAVNLYYIFDNSVKLIKKTPFQLWDIIALIVFNWTPILYSATPISVI